MANKRKNVKGPATTRRPVVETGDDLLRAVLARLDELGDEIEAVALEVGAIGSVVRDVDDRLSSRGV